LIASKQIDIPTEKKTDIVRLLPTRKRNEQHF
jgi:hypothetical protein